MALRLVLGAILSGGLSAVVAALIGCTGLVGGTGRYGAILAGKTPGEVERLTAFGFFGNLCIGCVDLLIESTA
jgi:hypothetical protein